MEQSKKKIELSIYSFSILMMGVIAIAGGMGVIAQQFPGRDIGALIALPSIPIIIVTIVAGKLQEYIPIKILVVIGVLCFIVGGILPVFMTDFSTILVMRVIFGVGVGLSQTLSSALVGMHFEGAERQKVMGLQTSAQMIGAAVMMFASGYLARFGGWSGAFYVHLLAIVSLIVVLICLPMDKPLRNQKGGDAPAEKVKLTGAAVGWAVTLTIFFFAGMILAQFLALYIGTHIITDDPGVAATVSGWGTMIFALGGFFMGLLYGRLNSVAKNATLGIGLFVGVAAYLIVGFSGTVPVMIVGSFLYGACVSIVMASVMTATAMSVSPIAIPLAIALTTCGQNIGSYICPYIATAVGGLLGDDLTRNVFIFGAILFAVMGVITFIRGIAQNSRKAA
jgi:MFS family permease